MPRLRRALLLALLLALPLAGCSSPSSYPAAVGGHLVTLRDGIGLEIVAGGLERPVEAVAVPDSSGRLLVAQQGGQIVVLRGAVAAKPLLDISDRLATGHREQGLLGLALHPSFQENGRLFAVFTDRPGDVVLAEWRIDPASLTLGEAPPSGQELLRVPQPKPYHNGGHVAFGPDGYLYLGLGDGGPQGDPDGNAQNRSNLLGSIVRLDVSEPGQAVAAPGNPLAGGGGRAEIWAWGLRNPWRFSFDPQGNLWIGDVGLQHREEINRIAAGEGGINLGWPRWEGHHLRDAPPIDEPVLFPIWDQPHTVAPCDSVTAGHVYAGSALPALTGAFVFGDFCTGIVRVLEPNPQGWRVTGLLETGRQIASFGRTADGELLIVDYQGAVLRLIAT